MDKNYPIQNGYVENGDLRITFFTMDGKQYSFVGNEMTDKQAKHIFSMWKTMAELRSYADCFEFEPALQELKQFRETLKHFLQMFGYEVVTICNAETLVKRVS